MYPLQIIYLFLPAGVANMLPPLAAILLPKLSQPLDFHATFRGKRVFGDHKTIRGIVIGTVFGGLVYYIQLRLYQQFDYARILSLINYETASPFFGISIAFGSLVGDAIKSFFKRQFNITPGTSWFPWDQIDWVIGSCIFAIPFIPVSLFLFVSFVITGLLLHLLFKILGYLFKVNKSVI